jgi:cytochrome c biogenesis protein CcmG/thiol:disulfide interchange protein DsbE
MKFFLMLVAAVALAVPAFPMQGAQNAAPSEMKPLPGIKLQDFDGKKVAVDGLKGNVLVLDFWATWCKPCLDEVPSWNKLQQKYGDKGLKVIGVALASDAKDVKQIADNKMKYTVLIGDDDESYNLSIFAFPTTYIVTKDLKIYRTYTGKTPQKEAQIEADIQKLLEQK